MPKRRPLRTLPGPFLTLECKLNGVLLYVYGVPRSSVCGCDYGMEDTRAGAGARATGGDTLGLVPLRLSTHRRAQCRKVKGARVCELRPKDPPRP